MRRNRQIQGRLRFRPRRARLPVRGRAREHLVGQQIEQLAEFVASARWDDIPDSVRRHTKMVLLDTLGVILAGGERPEVRQLRERLSGGTGATVYARGWPAQDARTAALLNGIAGRSIELCEGLRFVSGQAAMQVLPGVLAVAEQVGSAGRDILMALLLGYDVAARLGGAFTPTTVGAPERSGVADRGGRGGCPVARARRGHGISLAMRIATTLVLMPSYTNAVSGATALNIAGGMSGFAAALAPDLAMAGFEAQDNAIELALSELVGGGFTTDGVVGRARHHLAHHEKLFPAVRVLQSDPSGAGLSGSGADGIATATGGYRADRLRDVSVCLGDAGSEPAQLFRVEILVAARGGDHGRARACRVRGAR